MGVPMAKVKSGHCHHGHDFGALDEGFATK